MKASDKMHEVVANSAFVRQIKEGTLTIDNSEFSTWGSCFTMGLFYGGLRRVSARSRGPLAFGGAVHVGLDHFFKFYQKMDERELIDGALSLAFADAATTNLDDIGDPKRNTQRLEDLLRSYFLHYSLKKSDQFKIVELDGKRIVEESFVVPLGTLEIQTAHFLGPIQVNWSGKMDMFSHYDVAYAPVDHKTTSVMGEKFVDDKIRSSQMTGYTYAGRYLAKAFGNRPVFGARINALAQRSGGFEFKIFDIPIPDWKVAEWQSETLAAVGNLIRQLDFFLSTGITIPTREHCVTKYGKCQYFDICDTHPTMRDRMMFDDSYYFISEWSPLD